MAKGTAAATRTIELDDPGNLRRQAREWIVERIGWIVVAGVLIGAMLGFLGPGPLGKRQMKSADGRLTVGYYAVERYGASSELHIRFEEPSETATVRLGLARSFADEVIAERITPEPETEEMQDDQIVYTFRRSGDSGEGSVVYRYRHNSCGRLQYTVRLVGGSSVGVTQFVCP